MYWVERKVAERNTFGAACSDSECRETAAGQGEHPMTAPGHHQSFYGQEVHVSFSGLSFTVEVDPEDVPAQGRCQGKPPRVPKRILDGLDGRFEHGKLTAIMGASGAGKTTMLNCIAGVASDGVIEGQVLINGRQIDSETMRRVSAFVFQDDIILESMTVREVITLSARLRLPKNMTVAEKDKRVQQVIDVLHLQKCADTICGSPTSSGGISGGERKRTAIGMELITNPSVLFLDEPTTGLDTYTAFSVMDTLRQLALTGRTVVATIHQPSSDTFHLFDNLLVLAEGGIVYQAAAAGAVGYFGELGFVCPNFTNPADYLFMKVLNVHQEREGHAGAQRERVKMLSAAYTKHPMCAAARKAAVAAGEGIDITVIAERPGFLLQVPRLMVRNMRNIVRNPMGLRARFGQAVVMGAIVALVYHGLDNDQSSVQSRTGALFFCAMNMMMSAFSVLAVFFQVVARPVATVMLVVAAAAVVGVVAPVLGGTRFPLAERAVTGVEGEQEKTVFEREQSHGMYSTEAFFATKVLTELPMNVIFPFLQGVIVYWSLGLQPDAEKFLLFCALTILNINAGQALGVFIASMFTDLRVTLVVAPPLILPLMIFSGFFINTESIPPYFNWIKYLSPIKYAFEGLALNEFTGLEVVCAHDELKANPSCSPAEPVCFCPITSGEQVLQSLNIDEGLSIAENLGCLVGIYSGMLLLAYISLRRIIASREAKRSKFSAHAPSKRRSLLPSLPNGSTPAPAPPAHAPLPTDTANGSTSVVATGPPPPAAMPNFGNPPAAFSSSTPQPQMHTQPYPPVHTAWGPQPVAMPGGMLGAVLPAPAMGGGMPGAPVPVYPPG